MAECVAPAVIWYHPKHPSQHRGTRIVQRVPGERYGDEIAPTVWE